MTLNIIRHFIEQFVTFGDQTLSHQEIAWLNTRGTSRHSLEYADIASVELDNDKKFSVFNLSYGGLSIIDPQNQLEESLKKSANVTLVIHHLKVHCDIAMINRRGNYLGCNFIHSGPEVLVFLREVLEFIRIGTTLKPQEKDKSIYYTEELDTRFICNRSATNQTISTELVFTSGKSEVTIRLTEDILSIDNSNEALTLQRAFFILIGLMKNEKNQAIRYITEKMMIQLDVSA